MHQSSYRSGRMVAMCSVIGFSKTLLIVEAGFESIRPEFTAYTITSLLLFFCFLLQHFRVNAPSQQIKIFILKKTGGPPASWPDNILK